jgi:starvation-inducible outer membrane lipoprotein
MKAITKLAFIFTMSLLTMACATVPANRAERYNFDDELMKVNQI